MASGRKKVNFHHKWGPWELATLQRSSSSVALFFSLSPLSSSLLIYMHKHTHLCTLSLYTCTLSSLTCAHSPRTLMHTLLTQTCTLSSHTCTLSLHTLSHICNSPHTHMHTFLTHICKLSHAHMHSLITERHTLLIHTCTLSSHTCFIQRGLSLYSFGSQILSLFILSPRTLTTRWESFHSQWPIPDVSSFLHIWFISDFCLEWALDFSSKRFIDLNLSKLTMHIYAYIHLYTHIHIYLCI